MCLLMQVENGSKRKRWAGSSSPLVSCPFAGSTGQTQEAHLKRILNCCPLRALFPTDFTVIMMLIGRRIGVFCHHLSLIVTVAFCGELWDNCFAFCLCCCCSLYPFFSYFSLKICFTFRDECVCCAEKNDCLFMCVIDCASVILCGKNILLVMCGFPFLCSRKD